MSLASARTWPFIARSTSAFVGLKAGYVQGIIGALGRQACRNLNYLKRHSRAHRRGRACLTALTAPSMRDAKPRETGPHPRNRFSSRWFLGATAYRATLPVTQLLYRSLEQKAVGDPMVDAHNGPVIIAGESPDSDV